MRSLITILSVGVALVGCAHKQPLTLDQMDSALAENKAAAQRIYPGKTPDQVRAASQKVIYLLDPPDIKFDIRDNQLLATRFSTFYFVFGFGFGRDWYSVNMKKVPEGVESTFGVYGEQVAGIITDAIPLSFKANIPVSAHDNPEDFRLFHDRVEYLLGLRPSWTTCEEAKNRSKSKSKMLLCDSVGLENLSPISSQ